MNIPFMLGLQASGMVLDYYSRQQQNNIAREGARLEQEMIMRNLNLSRIQTADESLQAMIQLRKNIGSQAAIYAARGVSGPMTTLSINESVGNFNANERMRKINQKTREANFETQIKLSKLHQKSFEQRNNNEFYAGVLNSLPSNPDVYKKIGASFGLDKA